ncbi:hypothetical protein C0J52_01480 [Blattella germanica]|nr:hypothetical protein C0J52_01480 [Blattella germanica]
MSYVRVLHAVCAVYLLYLDAHLLPISYEILTTRPDIVRGHFAGLGLQFYTFWNQIAQQVFTFLVFALDISDVIKLPISKQLKAKLRNLSNDLFMYFVFPSAITVAVNFWMMYAFLENNLIEDFEVIQRHVPPWANQCLHTVILILPALEILASWKPYPKRMQGLFKSLIVVMCYTVWTIFARIIGGRWPYPFLSLLSPAGLLLYTFGNTTLSSVSYLIGHEFNQAVWGSKQLNKKKNKRT